MGACSYPSANTLKDIRDIDSDGVLTSSTFVSNPIGVRPVIVLQK